MRRRLFTLLSAGSLVLCLAACVLWVRSWHHPPEGEDRLSWLAGTGERYTVRSDAGTLTLFRPPTGDPEARATRPYADASTFDSDDGRHFDPSRHSERNDPRFRRNSPGLDDPTARETAAAMRNAHVVWNLREPPGTWTRDHIEGTPDYLFSLDIARGLPSDDLAPVLFREPDAVAALLPALEDPDRFAVAHLLLIELRTGSESTEDILPEGGLWAGTVDGLRVRLSQPPAERTRARAIASSLADES